MGKSNNVDDLNNLNIIGSGTKLKGNIESSGDIRIDGTIDGVLDTKGKLVIGKSGKAIGEIHCKNAEVSGTIDGKLTVEELLTFRSTAKVIGDIITSKLAIEPGAIFSGTCTMDGKSDDQDTAKKRK